MYPFINPFTGPFGVPFGPLSPFACNNRRVRIPTVDQRGIPEVCTTGMVETVESSTGAEDSVDYGINPRVWRALPNQSLILWKVKHPVSQNGASLPVNVVIPSGSGSSTVTSSGSSAGTTKIKVVDNKSTQTEGRDVTVPTGSGSEEQQSYTTEHIVYIDKCAGIFRLLGVTAQNSPARVTPTTPTTPDTPAE